ncbi:hypothetical protein HUK45_01465 [Limosilactobacillus sp. c9Ua_26_M]|uniref:Thoeris anti-defense 2-like domain-containing protein n=1 Tax=Limosilactobacillus urinaemulieris TaxID=2742600 RepID=A0ABR8ZJG9_9LACO|nr:hypothetical protein [Limosilactobacillus urinaemulieris]MBD8084943.1 hypothetical protein [Limosilactobacillus urinaemulieris]
MNIYEACKKIKPKQAISRKHWSWDDTCIVPTEGPGCCELFVLNRFAGIRWDPKKEDLTANDWYLIKKGPYQGTLKD